MSDQQRALLAVVLSGVVLVAWQFLYAGKQETLSPQTPVIESAVNKSGEQTPQLQNQATSISPQIPTQEMSSITLRRDNYQWTVSSDLAVMSAEHPNITHTFTDVVGGTLLGIQVNDGGSYKPLLFTFTQISDQEVQGQNSQYGVQVQLKIDERGLLQTKLNTATEQKFRYYVKTDPKSLDSYSHRQFVFYTNDVTRVNVGDDKTADGTLKWVGVDHSYHFAGLVFQEKVPAVLSIFESGVLTLDLTTAQKELSFYQVFVRKNYDELIALGDNLKLVVDFGFFGILAVPILRGLQGLYRFIPNYGLAIIVLTLLIRLITYPLQYKSFKSMKKMQVVQPELAKLKEKHKDNPQLLQKETMELFKRTGANPLSGCLPLLLQIPIFFALYKVLASSVELVGAPFYFWIHDLSIKDPYYVLPLLMTVSMFLQQKMTPTTSVDPVQQKILMFMPVIFGFIMKDLPSGLVLYIFVSTLFGILQQLYVYKTADA